MAHPSDHGNDHHHESNISAVEKGNLVLSSEDLILSSNPAVDFAQRLLSEFIGTYCLIFAGCGSVAVNQLYGGAVTFPGISVTWGLIVMVMIYTIGHVSAHFNPAVTITLALLGLFPFKEVIFYIMAQTLASIFASGTLALILDITPKAFFGTVPCGSTMQSFIVEIIITSILMFVICGSTIDRRAFIIFLSIMTKIVEGMQSFNFFIASFNANMQNKKYGGIVVGMTITLNVFVAGPISGASMNPARSLGPALVLHNFKGLWAYICGPIIGAIVGGFLYNLFKPTHRSFSEMFK